jgi:hypothetical protein
MHGLRDPFAYLLQELHDRDAGRRPPWAPGQRQQLLDDLLLIEALELAHGKRHLSVVFENPGDPVVAQHLDDIMASLTRAMSSAEGLRVAAADGRLTVTVSGPGADGWIKRAELIIDRYRPLGGRLLESPRV